MPITILLWLILPVKYKLIEQFCFCNITLSEVICVFVATLVFTSAIETCNNQNQDRANTKYLMLLVTILLLLFWIKLQKYFFTFRNLNNRLDIFRLFVIGSVFLEYHLLIYDCQYHINTVSKFINDQREVNRK